MIIIIIMIITWSGSCRRRKAPSLRSWPRLLSWRNLLRRSHLVDFDAFVWFWFWRLCLILILILMTLSDCQCGESVHLRLPQRLSSSSSLAKEHLKGGNIEAKLCFYHFLTSTRTPVRILWSQRIDYFSRFFWVERVLLSTNNTKKLFLQSNNRAHLVI